MFVTLLVLIAAAAAWGWGRIEAAKREEAREEEARESYRRRLEADPRNAAAYEMLGDSLRRAGRLEDAAQAYDGALAIEGGETGTQDRTQAKRRQIERDLAEQASKGLPKAERELYFCPTCGAGNPPQIVRCEACDALMPINRYRDALLNRELLRASLEGIAIIAVLLLAFRIFDMMPIEIKGLLIISATFVLGWRFLQAIEGRRG